MQQRSQSTQYGAPTYDHIQPHEESMLDAMAHARAGARGLMRRLRLGLAAIGLGLAFSAQAYPDRPITLIVGWAPGGSTDVISRLIAGKLGEELKESVIVLNRPGASGTIAAAFVSKERADGYTLYYGTNSTYAIAPYLYTSLNYNFNQDFDPISFIGSMPMILGVHPNVKANNVSELVELAKKNPGELNFGSSSPGSTSHLAMELLMAQTETDLLHVPYKGGGPAMLALVGGEVDMIFNDIATLSALINADKVRGLAVSSMSRLPNMPNLPTVAESGVPGFEVATTNALFAPKGTPAAVIDTLQSALAKVLDDPSIRQELLQRGMLVESSTPEELNKRVLEEQQKWRDLLSSRGIKLN